MREHKHTWFFIKEYGYLDDVYFRLGCECGACKDVKRFSINNKGDRIRIR